MPDQVSEAGPAAHRSEDTAVNRGESGADSGAARQAGTALLGSATASLAEAHALLANGSLQGWMDSMAHWESAGRSLGSWCASVERTPPGSRVGASWAVERQKIGEFQKRAFEASMLYQHAASFYLGWMRLLGELSGARYSPAGPAFEVTPGRKVSVDG